MDRLHFVRLHKRVHDHAGIVVCTFDTDNEAIAGWIDREIRLLEPLEGALIRVDRD